MNNSAKNQLKMKILLITLCFTIAASHPLDKGKDATKSKLKMPNQQMTEKLKGAESMYHSLPMPFVHYPFPFVNGYTTRYFPYGYAGLGYGLGYGYGHLGYGWGLDHYL